MTIHPSTQVNWQSHLRAVSAIAWKNWLHFIRYPLNALFSVLQPLIWLTPVYFLGQSFRSEAGNVGFAAYTGIEDYMSFIIIGSMLSSYVSSVFWGMGFALKNEMDSGVMESNWLTPVPRFAFLVFGSPPVTSWRITLPRSCFSRFFLFNGAPR